jgi:HTH-type transcriptional regulator/antitoxin HigA
MRTKILKTEQEYNEACKRIYSLMHSSETAIEPDSPRGEELELLSLLVEKYELEHHQLEAPDPIEAIKFRMEQMNLRQADIAPLFGGKTRVSEVLHRRRPLTLKMIRDLPVDTIYPAHGKYFSFDSFMEEFDGAMVRYG